MGGAVPIVNIDGVKAGDLALDGAILAKIFLGEIKSWNDPAIQRLNPEAFIGNNINLLKAGYTPVEYYETVYL